MRGFDATSAIFIDGIRDNGNYSRDIFNLEQVEVVKGPSGDNGRGSAGGFINLSSKSPRPEQIRNATLSYGFDEYASIDRQRYTADVNESADNGVAVRVNALWQEGGVAGRDYTEKNTWGVAPSIGFGLGSENRAILSYQHTEQNDLPDFGALGGNLEGTATAARPPLPIDRSRFYGLSSDFDDVTTDNVTARLEHDFNKTTQLSNVTRFSKTDREAIYAVPASYVPATGLVTTNRQAFDRENETVANVTNLNIALETGAISHTIATGLELSREKAHTLRDWTGLGTVTPADPYQPNPARPVTAFAPTHAWVDDVQVDTAALYAYDTLKLSPRWQATGGLRLEHYAAEASFRQRSTGNVIAYDTDGNLVSGKIGLVFKPKTNGSIYAAYGISSLPPGTNWLSNDNGSRNSGGPTDPNTPIQGSLTGQNSPNADAQKSFNYEIGTKWDFFNRTLSTSLALFRSERTNIAVANDTSGNPAVFGDQEVQGIELGVSGKITDAWLVFGGWSYLESENSNPANAVQNGTEVVGVPDHSANIWTTYRLPFGLTIGAGGQYAGESRLSLSSTSLGVLPSYWVANAMLSYQVNEHLNIRLNVDNVTDEFYARAVNNNSNRAYYGDPRNFLLTAEVKF
jgi:catecholate siderophore receptor